MPYKIVLCGIYKICNKVTGECYVGQSRNLNKRIAEHFRLLRRGTNPNMHLQASYTLHGKDAFSGEIEVLCETPEELDILEEAFLQGDAWFGKESKLFNISSTAHAPMTNKTHSEEVRVRIRMGRRATTYDYQSVEYRKKLSDAHMTRFRADPKFMDKLKYILDNDHLSYAERARKVGNATTSVRRLYLKYQILKGTL